MGIKEISMQEIFEFRIDSDFFHLLPKPNNGKASGIVYIVTMTRNDPNFQEIGNLKRIVKEKYDKSFVFGWQIKRKYSIKELDTATLLHLKIKAVFEPTGEECGTQFDETVACEICGANRKQVSPLILKKGTIPKKDIAKTIGGEVVVSEKFVNAIIQRKLKGLVLTPAKFERGVSGYYQLTASTELGLSHHTAVGIDPFDFSESSEEIEFTVLGGGHIKFEKEIYKCPNGDSIGLNILSECYVLNSQSIREYDFFASKQKIGTKRGLLRPEPVYFCSQAFKRMIEEEKLTGFEFETAHIE